MYEGIQIISYEQNARLISIYKFHNLTIIDTITETFISVRSSPKMQYVFLIGE